MATVSDAIGMAWQYRQAGRLAEAERICREILAVAPDHVGALRMLGAMACQVGEYSIAVDLLQRTIQQNSNLVDAHCNLGTALQQLGRLTEAGESFRRAIALQPELAEAHFNLGNVLKGQGDVNGAIACYRHALQLKPSFAEAHTNLALVLAEQGQLEEAALCYRKALEHRPELFEAHIGLGTILQQQRKVDEAIGCYRRALELNPNSAEAHNNLGMTLTVHGQFDEARACLERAIDLNPNLASAHQNLGNVYHEQRTPTNAIACYRRALSLAPDFAEAHHALGASLEEIGQFDEAADCYDGALNLQPDFAEAHMSRARLRLRRGDFEKGWAEFEWRWKTGQLPVHAFRQPQWNGQIHLEQTILLHVEQGLGDTLQFIRYAQSVKKCFRTVVAKCLRPLVPLVASCPGIDQLIEQESEIPQVDVHVALMSLPRIMGTRMETIPNNVPYLFAAASLVQEWRERLASIDGFRIGINWHGRGGPGPHLLRDIPVTCFALLGRLPRVRLISLQKGAMPGELALFHDSIFDPGPDIDTMNGAFMDTAAIMMNLDLVITSDTAIANLAGALGVPVWVGLPFLPDWRWLMERTDSPWYPTMRLFRQKEPGEWFGVFAEMTAALEQEGG